MSIFRYAELRGFWYLGILDDVPLEHSELPGFTTREYWKYSTRLINPPYICSTAIVEDIIRRYNIPAAMINQWRAVCLRYYNYRDTIV